MDPHGISPKINAMKTPLSTKVDLSMLPTGASLKLYTDDADLNGSVKTVKLNKKKTLDVVIPTNGAFLAIAKAAK